MKSVNRNLLLLGFSLIVVMLGYGLVIPLMPFYIDKLGASGKQLGLLTATYSVMQFLFAPFWGAVSDRIGRKPVLMLGILGNGLFLLLFGLASELWMLFLARALAGILASATSPATMAYISDSTSRQDRSGAMGKLGAAMGLGVILGPGLGGWLAGVSLATPFYVAAGLSLLSLLLIAVLLPESHPAEPRSQKGLKLAAFRTADLRSALLSPIGVLLFLAFLLSFGMTSFEGIFGLYALNKFDYGPQEVGTIMVVIGLVSAAVQALLTGPLTKRWGEAVVIRASLLGVSVGFLVMLLARTFPTVLLTTGLFVFAVALLRPAVTALISKQTTGGQGAAMGLANSFSSLGRMAGPVWAGFLFDLNYNLPFVSGAVILLAGFLVSLRWVKQEPSVPAPAQPPERWAKVSSHDGRRSPLMMGEGLLTEPPLT
jgi:DHA1 family multidrug resistance protein-like MFS transporter